MRALKIVKEKASVYIKQFNPSLKEDEIVSLTNNITEIIDIKYKKFFVESQNGRVSDMYEATVTVKVDTDKLKNLSGQNKPVEKNIPMILDTKIQEAQKYYEKAEAE